MFRFFFSGLLGKTKLSNLKRFFFCITYYGYPALIKCWKRLQEDEDDEEENNDGAEDERDGDDNDTDIHKGYWADGKDPFVSQRTPHQPGCLSVCLFIKPDLSNDDDDGGGDDDNDDGDCRRIYFDPIIWYL